MIFKASHLVFSPFAVDCKNYAGGVKIGTMMNVSVAETFRELGALSRGKAVFQNAAISIGTRHVPIKAYEKMFGCEIINNVIIDPPTVGVPGGFGYITEEFDERGETVFCVTWIRRCTFIPPPQSAVSAGSGSVTITTFAINGTAYRPASGKWREREFFETADEAIERLSRKAGGWFE